MNEVRFIYWLEHECPKCGNKMLKRRPDAEPNPEYPTQALYACDWCGHKEYRDVEDSTNN